MENINLKAFRDLMPLESKVPIFCLAMGMSLDPETDFIHLVALLEIKSR